MALYKPNQLSPSNSTIDATEINRFSWQTNGALQSTYRVRIYDNDDDETPLHDSDVVISPNEYYDLDADVLTNGTNCKWYVTTTSGALSQDSEYEFFVTNDTPVVTFSSPDFTGGFNDVIENFQDTSNWVIQNGTKQVNTLTYLPIYGTQSIYIQDTVGYQFVSIKKTSSYDFTEFSNGLSSDSNDEIYLVAYTVDASRFTADGIQIKLYTDGSNYYYTNFPSSGLAAQDWNYLSKAKSDFSSVGSPNWANITAIEVGYETNVGLLTEKNDFQAIELRQVGDGESIIIPYQDWTFTMAYSQDQNISSKKYKYILSDSNGTEITDTDWIYDFSLSYEFTGFSNNTQYQIEGIVVSQNDQEASTGVKDVTIIYLNNNSLPAITATSDDENGTVTIDWSNIKFSTATYSGGTPNYVAGKFDYGLDLPDGEYVELTDLSTNSCYTLTAWIKFKLGHDGDFCQIGVNKAAGYEASTQRFYYNNDGDYSYSAQITLYTWTNVVGTWEDYELDTWETLGLSPTEYMDNFLFWGITCSDYIVKKENTLRAYIDISV